MLHGGGGDHLSYLSNTRIEAWALEHRMAVVLPAVGRCHYADIPPMGNFFTYLADELPAMLRKYLPLSGKREDNAVCGISAGGLGAAKLAFNRPDRYAVAGVLSIGPMSPAMMCEAFREVPGPLQQRIAWIYGGDPHNADGTPDDIWWAMEDCVRRGVAAPALFSCCGKDDFAYPGYLRFKDKVLGLGLDACFGEEEGRGHSWDYWNEMIPRFLEWFEKRSSNVLEGEQ